MGHPSRQDSDGGKIPALADLPQQQAFFRDIGKRSQTSQEFRLLIKNRIKVTVKQAGPPFCRRGGRNMDGQFDIMVAFLLLIYEIELLLNIFVWDRPIQFLSQDLFPTDLKIFLCNRVEDLDAALGIGKEQSLLEIF